MLVLLLGLDLFYELWKLRGKSGLGHKGLRAYRDEAYISGYFLKYTLYIAVLAQCSVLVNSQDVPVCQTLEYDQPQG
jgi:hypothetical protein